jgi:hypothetical protein
MSKIDDNRLSAIRYSRRMLEERQMVLTPAITPEEIEQLAEELIAFRERVDEQPEFKRGQFVEVKHQAFTGVGIVDHDTGFRKRMVFVRLENNNVWPYESNTVTLKAEKCPHERLNEDGICRRCGADCRGIS